ncbi:MAG TPA: phosphoribosylformylglycinamidine synthase subunit PurQ [Candidatus Kapabacteria bacterium]|nr:phosphoribosylformylglycinamidine synthase subunit PurQ [Candidatus Kapabacteria bacterium]
MRTRIVVFPGSNCDHDAMYAVKNVLGEADTEFVWHKDSSIGKHVDLVILPGGFSFGDYLRTGAIARFSPVMNDVIRFANDGGTVLGICNGFQVLCESGLLPGVLVRNSGLKFRCKQVYLRTENSNTQFTNRIKQGTVLEIPIAHGEGNFIAEPDVIRDLESNGQVVFRYSTPEGEITEEANPNGSIGNIAGIVNKEGNVFGLMPHPERACDKILGSADGLNIFRSLKNHFDSVREQAKEKRGVLVS